MNILYVSSKKKWGGVISWKVRTATELEKRGHHVWIISAKKSALTRKVPDNIRLVPKKFGMDYNPFLILYLVYFIRKHNIDIVATNIKKEVIAGGLAAKLCGVPAIRFIGNERDFKKIKFLQRFLIENNIVPCLKTKELILEQNNWLHGEELTVIHIGHNVENFSSQQVLGQKKKWGLSETDLVIGVTCRLVRSKGLEFLIKAFDKVSQQYTNIYLVIAGEGNYKEHLITFVNNRKLNNRVIFTGFVQNSMLSAAAYDIAVLMSEYEAFPYTIVEYFAVGKPVIATNVGGVKEIIHNGENGFLIDVNNESQLTEKLSLLIKNRTMRETFSREAIRTITEKFSEDIMIDKFERFFIKVART